MCRIMTLFMGAMTCLASNIEAAPWQTTDVDRFKGEWICVESIKEGEPSTDYVRRCSSVWSTCCLKPTAVRGYPATHAGKHRRRRSIRRNANKSQ